jgi:D-sedoheptulose 7-phosphate isomerase
MDLEKLENSIKSYTREAQGLISLECIKASDAKGIIIPYIRAFSELVDAVDQDISTTVYFIGNGGSAGIASENANRLRKFFDIRTMTFNDPVSMSASANDSQEGWVDVFAQPLSSYIRRSDVLIAISSSGMSENIIKAVKVARREQAKIFTFSGFEPTNKLRALGDYNFYTPSRDYQLVESVHAHILACLTNILKGLKEGQDEDKRMVR